MPSGSKSGKKCLAKLFIWLLFIILAGGCANKPKTPGEGALEGALLGAQASAICTPILFLVCLPFTVAAGAIIGAAVSENPAESSAPPLRPAPPAVSDDRPIAPAPVSDNRPIKPAPIHFAAAGIVEQTPKLQNYGCAPFNARAGNVYWHEDGREVAIGRILGMSDQCTNARPLSVELR